MLFYLNFEHICETSVSHGSEYKDDSPLSDVVRTSETSVYFNETAWWYIPEDSSFRMPINERKFPQSIFNIQFLHPNKRITFHYWNYENNRDFNWK
jgi:hypothetical protein